MKMAPRAGFEPARPEGAVALEATALPDYATAASKIKTTKKV